MYTKAISGVPAGRSARIWLYTSVATFPLVPRWRATSPKLLELLALNSKSCSQASAGNGISGTVCSKRRL
eukprot:6201687-Pleurochrysis_carterae.AAC.2